MRKLERDLRRAFPGARIETTGKQAPPDRPAEREVCRRVLDAKVPLCPPEGPGRRQEEVEMRIRARQSSAA